MDPLPGLDCVRPRSPGGGGERPSASSAMPARCLSGRLCLRLAVVGCCCFPTLVHCRLCGMPGGKCQDGTRDSFIMRSDIPATGSFRPKLAGEASDRLGREGLGRSEFAKAVHSNGPTKFVFVRPCPAAWAPKSTMYLVHQLAPHRPKASKSRCRSPPHRKQ